MSLWKKLFGGASSGSPAAPKPTAEVEHNGFTVRAEPYQEGGQYQTAGTVLKEVDGVRREHRFVRADRFPTQDDATEFSLRKGRQLVDEQGERMFAKVTPVPPGPA